MKLKDIYSHVEEPTDARVIIPYVKASHQLQTVVDCLRIQRVQPELHKVGDGDSYWKLLKDVWAEGEEFILVEHDVLVWMGGIENLRRCEKDWCTLPTMCHGLMFSTALGCVKFGKQLIERYPGFWDDIPTTWFTLDASFADKMGWPYIRPCIHNPPATHLNEIQWGDSISTRWALERKIAWQAKEVGDTLVRVKYRLKGDKRRGERVAAGEVIRTH